MTRKPRPAASSRRPQRTCPICGKPAAAEAFPFCSKRCKDVDLSRWLSGRYVIPASEEEPPGEEPLDDN